MINAGTGQLLRALIGSLLVVAITSCGLKGDLYLPEPETAANDVTQHNVETGKAVDAPAEASQTDASKDDDKATPSREQLSGAPSLP